MTDHGDCEFCRFIDKLEWEGGIEDLLGYGGPDAFPTELRDAAKRCQSALDEINDAIEAHDDSDAEEDDDTSDADN